VVRILMATPMATFGQCGQDAQDRKPHLIRCLSCGSKQTRTADRFLVREVLYQLSYAPGSLPRIRSRQD
jgi:hypothetical protein